MKCLFCQRKFTRNLSLGEIVFCQKLVLEEMCSNCQKLFEMYETQKVCYGCGRLSIATYCEDCQFWKSQYPDYAFHHEALYHYNDGMHEWFQQYKFKGDYYLGACFSKELKKYFKNKQSWLVVPIPLSKIHLKERGFNQVMGLLDFAEIVYRDLLMKEGDTVRQSQKTRAERLTLAQPFLIEEKNKELLKNKNILLVDDVYTTGRTMFHGATCLLKAGAKQVSTFSLAR